MRYRDFMVEAIPNRPRNLRAYLTKRIAELGQMLDDLSTAKTLINDGARDGGNLVRYAVRYGIEDTPYQSHDTDVWHLESLNLDREFQIDRLKQALESYQQYQTPGSDFLRYVMAALADAVKEQQRNIEYREEWTRAIKMLPYADAGLQTYGYTPGDPEHEADPEYIAGKKVLAGYRLKAKVAARIVPLEADLSVKLGVIVRMQAHNASMQGAHKYRPEHGDVETLYHATAYVQEVLRDGFLAERPNERKGVGNFGQQDLISFTHDLEIARNIMRSFKEIWMIAHRQLTGPQILGWVKAEGIEDDVRRMWRNDTSRPMPVTRDADPHDVVRLYRIWLALSKLRENPMLVSPWDIVDMMKDRTLKDIGVLACEVKLEQTDDYKWAEAEFRLPADRVQSIKQVL